MKNILLIMTDWLKYNCNSLPSVMPKVNFSGILLILFLGLFLIGCNPNKPKIFKNQNVGPALGTSYNIIYLSHQELDYQKEIDSVFAAVNKSMSTYIQGSDISKINQGDSTLVVDHMFQDVFRLSKEVYEETESHFDPTVGVLVDAWGFGPGKQIALDSTRVDSLMYYVGFDKVSLTAEKTIHKENPKIKFDFNAIAKGYAIDRLAVLMNQKGIQNYLIEVGGEVVAKGQNIRSKRPWGVQIQDPQAERAKSAIRLNDKAMASSGNYRKFRIDSITGKKYVHTIDPKTGYTKNAQTLSANVIANTCAEADAYATAFMVMPLEDVIEFVNSKNTVEVYIIFLDTASNTKEYMSEGFKNVVLR